MALTLTHRAYQVTLTLLLFLSSCTSTAQKALNVESTAQSGRCMAMMPMSGQGHAPMMGGWHPNSPYGQLYFRGKQITLMGEISQIGPVVPRPSMMQGIQIHLKTTEGEKIIHLGPTWYLEQQDFQLRSGDKVTVQGRWVVEGENSFAVAEKVIKGAETLRLRDDNGFPLWAGVRPREMAPTEPKSSKK